MNPDQLIQELLSVGRTDKAAALAHLQQALAVPERDELREGIEQRLRRQALSDRYLLEELLEADEASRKAAPPPSAATAAAPVAPAADAQPPAPAATAASAAATWGGAVRAVETNTGPLVERHYWLDERAASPLIVASGPLLGSGAVGPGARGKRTLPGDDGVSGWSAAFVDQVDRALSEATGVRLRHVHHEAEGQQFHIFWLDREQGVMGQLSRDAMLDASVLTLRAPSREHLQTVEREVLPRLTTIPIDEAVTRLAAEVPHNPQRLLLLGWLAPDYTEPAMALLTGALTAPSPVQRAQAALVASLLQWPALISVLEQARKTETEPQVVQILDAALRSISQAQDTPSLSFTDAERAPGAGPLALGMVVALALECKADDLLLDSTEATGQPLAFTLGSGALLPALEQALVGRRVGDAFEVRVAPEDAFGVGGSGAFLVPRDKFPAEASLEPGTSLTSLDETGQPVDFYVAAVQPDGVVITRDHPLAGRTLHYSVKILAAKAR